MTDTDEHTQDRDHGEVIKIFPEKLYGFIKSDRFANHDLFFHVTDLHESPPLAVGERVTFLPVTYKGRLKAKRIQREHTS